MTTLSAKPPRPRLAFLFYRNLSIYDAGLSQLRGCQG